VLAVSHGTTSVLHEDRVFRRRGGTYLIHGVQPERKKGGEEQAAPARAKTNSCSCSACRIPKYKKMKLKLCRQPEIQPWTPSLIHVRSLTARNVK
jgi:hypothetical protein